MQKPSHQMHFFAEFTLDLTRGCLLQGQEEIKLRPKSFEVLTYLVENHGRLISKSELIQAIWVDRAVTDDSVVQCMKDIRHALRDETQRIIKTVHGRGYIFDREEGNNGSVPVTTDAEEPGSVQVIIEDLAEVETSANSAARVSAATITRLTSPPFTSSAEYLVSEMKRHKRGVAIIAAGVVLTLAAVSYFYFNRNHSRIPGGDVIDSQDQRQLTKHYTENTEAYRLYSLGRTGLRGGQEKERLEESARYFEQAVKIDPHYALAYVGLSDAYYQLGFRGFWIPKDAWQKAELAALKAVELDDTLAEAHGVLGAEKLPRDWAGAEREFKRALELDANSTEVNRSYATYLAYSARPDEALLYAKRAEELDSRNPTGLRPAYLPSINFLARKYDTAIDGYRRAIEKNPNNAQFRFFLGEAYVAKGMYQDGVTELQKAVALDNAPERWDRDPILAYAYAVSGKRDEALKILNEQKRLANDRYISPYNFAIIYTGLGDKDRAFEVLNRALDEDVYVMNQVPCRPMFDRLRSDPRYKDLLLRMNRTP